MPPIYLDFNATTPVAPDVAAAMRPYLEEYFGNPSSSHWYGTQTKKAVTWARSQVAGLLGCDPDHIIFTSGGTESNNLAIKGAAFSLRSKGTHIITSAVEHPAVTEVCRYLEQNGFQITTLPVDETGSVSPTDLERVITPQTILVTIMHANNEVGTVQPIAQLARIAHRHGALFHTDAAQSAGKIPVRVEDLGVDMLSLAGHKFYAPKGVGALFVRTGITLSKLMHGADHEMNLRAGTENILEIVGIGKAAELAATDLASHAGHMETLRDRLEAGLKKTVPSLRINGNIENRLPNTTSISFPRIEANTLLDEIGGEIAASAGAACHTDSVDVSSVLEAMKVPTEFAMGTIRFSTGRMTTVAEIDHAIDVIANTVNRMQPTDHAVETRETSREEIRLTRYTHGLGCACKLRPQDLEQVLAKLPAPEDQNVLVGTASSDDAAVYRIDDDLAIVQTVDFFTPVVDDPFHFGAIAAANSLSDIYAMGARPLFGLNIVGFPEKRLSLDVLARILEGAQSKAQEAGISIIGGHSIEDTEPKYGLAVTGSVHPDRIQRNSGAQPRDAIVLTKPIGIGIITTAMKKGIAGASLTEEAIGVMSGLNNLASELMGDFDTHACTDVTGFGLLGHLKEMVAASGVDAVIWQREIPVLSGVRDLALEGAIPGGTVNNHAFVESVTDWNEEISRIDQMILCDAQTSGGLLIALPQARVESFLSKLGEKGITAAWIGLITHTGSGRIEVVPEKKTG